MLNLAQLFEATRKRIAPTKKQRLKLTAERSRVFNERTRREFESMQLTPELLAKRCTL